MMLTKEPNIFYPPPFIPMDRELDSSTIMYGDRNQVKIELGEA